MPPIRYTRVRYDRKQVRGRVWVRVELLGVEEVAGYLRMSYVTVWRW